MSAPCHNGMMDSFPIGNRSEKLFFQNASKAENLKAIVALQPSRKKSLSNFFCAGKESRNSNKTAAQSGAMGHNKTATPLTPCKCLEPDLLRKKK